MPELAALPNRFIHEPWCAPPEVLAAAGVTLGATYPLRVADTPLQELRARGVKAMREARAQHLEEWSDERGYDLVKVPKVQGRGWRGRRGRWRAQPRRPGRL